MDEGTSDVTQPPESSSNFNHAHQGALCEQLWSLRTEGALCDVILEADGETLTAHRLVLVAGSARLHTLISQQRPRQDGKLHILVEDLSFKMCMKLVDYIYTGRYPAEQSDEFVQGCRKWCLHFSAGLLYSHTKTENMDFHPVTPHEFPTDEILLCVKTHGEKSKGNSKPISKNVVNVRKGKGPKRLISKKTIRSVFKGGTGLVGGVVERSVIECDDCGKQTGDTPHSPAEPASLNPLTTRDTRTVHHNKPPTLLTDTRIGLRKRPQVNSPKRNAITLRQLKKKKQTQKVVTNGRKYRCGYCGSEFDSQAELKVHRVEEHGQKKKAESWCTVCQVKFNGRNLLLAHNMERHWAEGMELPKLYKCNKTGCDFTTYVQGTWYAHMSHMHNTEPIVCEICGRSYKHKFSLSSHMRHAHGPQKEFPCDQCERVFASDTGLRNHRKLAHSCESRLQHICPHCGHTSLCLSTLTEHLYTKHNILPKGRQGHECKYCDFKSLTQSVLNRHQSRHNPERPYKCDKCNKSYTERNQLKYHQIKHDNSAKMHQCQYCDYSTKYVQHFKEHVQVRHEKKDYKPYSCEDCSYRSNSRGNLYKHLRKVHKRVVETKPKLCKVLDLNHRSAPTLLNCQPPAGPPQPPAGPPQPSPGPPQPPAGPPQPSPGPPQPPAGPPQPPAGPPQPPDGPPQPPPGPPQPPAGPPQPPAGPPQPPDGPPQPPPGPPQPPAGPPQPSPGPLQPPPGPPQPPPGPPQPPPGPPQPPAGPLQPPAGPPQPPAGPLQPPAGPLQPPAGPAQPPPGPPQPPPGPPQPPAGPPQPPPGPPQPPAGPPQPPAGPLQPPAGPLQPPPGPPQPPAGPPQPPAGPLQGVVEAGRSLEDCFTQESSSHLQSPQQGPPHHHSLQQPHQLLPPCHPPSLPPQQPVGPGLQLLPPPAAPHGPHPHHAQPAGVETGSTTYLHIPLLLSQPPHSNLDPVPPLSSLPPTSQSPPSNLHVLTSSWLREPLWSKVSEGSKEGK